MLIEVITGEGFRTFEYMLPLHLLPLPQVNPHPPPRRPTGQTPHVFRLTCCFCLHLHRIHSSNIHAPALGHILQLANLPPTQENHTHRRSQIHEAGKKLRAKIVAVLKRHNLKSDGLAKGARQHEHDPNDVESRGDVLEADDLGGDGRDGGPEGACDCTAEDGVEDEDAVRGCKDPYDEGEEAGKSGHESGHVYAADPVGEVAYGGTAAGLTEIQERGDEGALGGGEADRGGVVGEREEQDDVGEHAEPAEAEEEQELGFAEEGEVKGELAGADYFVAVADQEGADAVDG